MSQSERSQASQASVDDNAATVSDLADEVVEKLTSKPTSDPEAVVLLVLYRDGVSCSGRDAGRADRTSLARALRRALERLIAGWDVGPS